MTNSVLPPELAGVAIVTAGITNWISQEDWDRLIGPWGGFVISLLLCALLLRHSAKRIRREDDRAKEDAADRKAMHQESLTAMEKTHTKFETLANRQMECQLETAKAILKMANASENLHTEMKGRRCLLDKCSDQCP